MPGLCVLIGRPGWITAPRAARPPKQARQPAALTRLVAARDDVAVGQPLHIPRGAGVGQLLRQGPSDVYPNQRVLVGRNELCGKEVSEKGGRGQLDFVTEEQRVDSATRSRLGFKTCVLHSTECAAKTRLTTSVNAKNEIGTPCSLPPLTVFSS
jgi:hypothetical protein